MLSSEEHPGTFTFLIGLIVLVFAGVGLSLLVDKRFTFSRNTSTLERSIAAGEEETNQLRESLRRYELRLAEVEPKRNQSEQTRVLLATRLQSGSARLDSLKEQLRQLQTEVPALDHDFAGYRSKYRQQEWTRAPGEALGDLKIRGGREYKNAVIRRVTEVGLEIHHENGIARIQAPDLDAPFHDRFQWDDEERRTRLKQESELHEKFGQPDDTAESTKTPAPVRPSRLKAAPSSAPDPAALAAARKKVIMWKARVGQLSSDKQQADLSSGSAQSSVPGSLETWRAKAARLTAELAKAKVELQLSKSELRELSPKDPLLRYRADDE